MKYSAIIDGGRIEIELNRLDTATIEAQIGGRKYLIDTKTVEPGVYWFNWNNRSMEISVVPRGDSYSVSLEGRSVGVEIVNARSALRKASQRGHTGAIELRAPMPGKIVKVLVIEGAEVQANQGIVVMEAMKMQNEIKSPKNGVVKKLAVEEGTPVNSGDLLAVVE
jgi:biotin carboxyl carrier protein